VGQWAGPHLHVLPRGPQSAVLEQRTCAGPTRPPPRRRTHARRLRMCMQLGPGLMDVGPSPQQLTLRARSRVGQSILALGRGLGDGGGPRRRRGHGAARKEQGDGSNSITSNAHRGWLGIPPLAELHARAWMLQGCAGMWKACRSSLSSQVQRASLASPLKATAAGVCWQLVAAGLSASCAGAHAHAQAQAPNHATPPKAHLG
jgi:hypothetical protein